MKKIYFTVFLIAFSLSTVFAATYRTYVSDTQTSPTSVLIVVDSDTVFGENVVGELRWPDGNGGWNYTGLIDFGATGSSTNGTFWEYEFTGLPPNTTFELQIGNRNQSGDIYGLTNFSPEPAIILPIKLSSFGVSKNQMGESFLQWTSESECEASHYEIERSVNGVDFEKIAEVQTRGGGDNCLGSSYDLTDKIQLERVFTSRVFYRLKMVDLDRSFEYSDVVAVDANRARFVFFNMNTKELLVENIEGAFTISISNINGDLILNQEMTSGTLSLTQLHKGMYFVTVMQNGMKMTEKIVIQ